MRPTVLLEPDGEAGLARVTFQRPEVLNAVNEEVLDCLEQVVGR
jgi:enoyl-CoA hydratase/carnithine racemase